jgi:hypothetical protein
LLHDRLDEKYASVILRRYAEFKKNSNVANGANDSDGIDDIFIMKNGEKIFYENLVKNVKAKGNG